MTCTEFLEQYTDYRDGLVTAPRERRRFERHLAGCASCRRYDAAVQGGVRALQAAGALEPSPSFRRRLDARLRAERESLRVVRPARAGIAAALLVAAALGLLALEGLLQPQRVTPSLPPVPFPKPVARAGVPFVNFQDPRASVVAGNPNPYGTALVEPASAGR